MLVCLLDANYTAFAMGRSASRCQEGVSRFSKVILFCELWVYFISIENSYAANGIKHCVRPYDMTGKSAAIILRQMHHRVMVSNTDLNFKRSFDNKH